MTHPVPALDQQLDETLLDTLQQLLALPALSVQPTLTHACSLLSTALQADKVDVLSYTPTIDSLVALGTSPTPLAAKERRLGLDRFPLSNGGCIVAIYQTGDVYWTNHADQDLLLPQGLRTGLGIRSMLGVPFSVGGVRRGVVLASSTREAAFTAQDCQFLETVAQWIGIITQRAELVEQVTQEVSARARQQTTEDLITLLAHDLGNHIAPIQGRIDLVLRRLAHTDRTLDQRDLNAARDGVVRLTRLIRDLLDLGRLSHGQMPLVPVMTDLAHLVTDTVRLLEQGAQTITIIAPEEVCLLIDPSRIRQVIENLLTNAIKHSPAGVPVTVTVRQERQTAGEVAVVRIEDQGPGIDPERLSTLFERFRMDAASTGLGLGLYIAQSIVTAHGGTLHVTSTLGIGSSFQLMLPLGETGNGCD